MLAHDYLLRGLWHFHQFNADDAAIAIDYFSEAIKRDSAMAEAYAALARTLLSKEMYGLSAGAGADAADIAKKALSLDPASPTAYYVLALVSAHRQDSSTAATLARRAIELNDNYTPAYFALAVATTYLGRPADSLAAIERALRLSPADPQRFVWLAQQASALYLLKRYQEALDTGQQALRLRWYHTACRVVAASHAQLGQLELARSAMAELLKHEHADKTIREVIRPFTETSDRDHYTEGLRKAGMPE